MATILLRSHISKDGEFADEKSPAAPAPTKPSSPKPPVFGGVKLPSFASAGLGSGRSSKDKETSKEPKGSEPSKEREKLKAEFDAFKAETLKRMKEFEERFEKLDESNVKL